MSLDAEIAQTRFSLLEGFFHRRDEAGNFYVRNDVTLPLNACVSRNGTTVCQQSPVTSGSCNSCHGLAVLGAPQPPLSAQ